MKDIKDLIKKYINLYGDGISHIKLDEVIRDLEHLNFCSCDISTNETCLYCEREEIKRGKQKTLV